jgi:site-specific DNA-methyltransferase (adenine-specific)
MLDFGFYNMDCMEGMKQFPDKFFELAIVDPPYGIGAYSTGTMGGGVLAKQSRYKATSWDANVPTFDYFDELRRVSKNQIIWGGNYYDLPPTSCVIAWDKDNGENYFADFELAWASFNTAARLYKYKWQGMLQGNMKNKEERIHPTQKPIALYEWLLTNYAHKGDKILDTHVGSASSLIACEKLGFQYHGFEIDADYYKAAQERIAKFKSQVSIFDIDESLPRFEQESMEV